MSNASCYPVVILAGGLATRLRPITEKIPKALIDINGEPFIIHQLRLLEKQGINSIIFCLGYLGEMIVDVVNQYAQNKFNISYCFDGPSLLGTAGAIKNALPQIPGDSFFVLYGDSYLPCDFDIVQRTYMASKKTALMTVFQNEGKWDSSNVEFDGAHILAYNKIKKTPRMHHIDYGLGIFNKKAFATVPANEPYDLAMLYQALLAQDQLAACLIQQRFYEVGSLAGIDELSYYLRQQSPI